MRTFILLLLMQLVSLPFSYARQPEHSTYAYSGGYPFSISGDIRSLPS